MTTTSFNSQQFLQASHEAVIVGMKIIRQHQLHPSNATIGQLKPDQTPITVVDSLVEKELVSILSERLPDYSITGEEATHLQRSSMIELFIDPIDGTRSFTNQMLTSTIIISAYDHQKKQVVGTTIAEPISGRIWTALAGQGCIRYLYDYTTKATVTEERCQVWQGQLAKPTTLFINSTRGFQKMPHIASLLTEIVQSTGLLITGSGGLQLALVANGGDRVVGGFSPYKGGPWDLGGVLLVTEAGGIAKAYQPTGSLLVEQDPLDILSYELLIVGNNQETVDWLIPRINACFSKGK